MHAARLPPGAEGGREGSKSKCGEGFSAKEGSWRKTCYSRESRDTFERQPDLDGAETMHPLAEEELFRHAYGERFAKMLWEPLLTAGWSFGGARYLVGDLASFDEDLCEIYIQDDEDEPLEVRAKWLNLGMKKVYDAHPQERLLFLANYLESLARHKVDSVKTISVILDISHSLAVVAEDPGARILDDLLRLLAGRTLREAALSGPAPGEEAHFIGKRSFYEGVEFKGLLPTGVRPELIRAGGPGDELERFFRAAARRFFALRRHEPCPAPEDAVEEEGAGFGSDIALDREALRAPGAAFKARMYDPKIPVPVGPSWQDEKHKK